MLAVSRSTLSRKIGITTSMYRNTAISQYRSRSNHAGAHYDSDGDDGSRHHPQ